LKIPFAQDFRIINLISLKSLLYLLLFSLINYFAILTNQPIWYVMVFPLTAVGTLLVVLIILRIAKRGAKDPPPEKDGG
jgi:hypothetical protein